MDERSSVELMTALSTVWASIRERHPDVPGVVLVTAAATRATRHVLGHFWALRWSPKAEGEADLAHEVAVTAEHLNRPAADIVETLLHEAAHAMCFARGVRDATDGGRYHNRKFKAAAEELGLLTEGRAHRVYGYSFTSLPRETAEAYAEQIALVEPVRIHRRPTYGPVLPPGLTPPAGPTTGGPTRPKTRHLKATCACPFIIRASRTTFERTSVVCGTCEQPFRLA